jgi:hypothetical protein
MKKTEAKKSRATVPLSECALVDTVQCVVTMYTRGCKSLNIPLVKIRINRAHITISFKMLLKIILVQFA